VGTSTRPRLALLQKLPSQRDGHPIALLRGVPSLEGVRIRDLVGVLELLPRELGREGNLRST
jgi:hypothetical protein